MFGNWLRGIDKQFSAHILVGAAALCWALWLIRNDVVFNKKICFIFYAGYSCMYAMTPYLVYPAEAEGQGPFYDGVYAAGVFGQGGFLPPWMAV